MGFARCRGVAFRLDDLLLAGVAAAIVVALIGRGHGADDARDVIRAKTIVAGAFRLPNPEEPGAAMLYISDDGPASLTFHSSRGWFFSLGSDHEHGQSMAFHREDLSGHGTILNVDESGSPRVTVADLKTSMEVSLSAVGGVPILKMVKASMASVILASFALPGIVFIKDGTEELRLLIWASDELTNLALLGEDNRVKGLLRMIGAAHPELSLHQGKSSDALQVGLDPMDRPFIRLNDQQTGTTRTLP